MNFINALIKFCQNGDAGKCPLCKNDLKVAVFKTGARESVEISCLSCNKSNFFTGAVKKDQ